MRLTSLLTSAAQRERMQALMAALLPRLRCSSHSPNTTYLVRGPGLLPATCRPTLEPCRAQGWRPLCPIHHTEAVLRLHTPRRMAFQVNTATCNSGRGMISGLMLCPVTSVVCWQGQHGGQQDSLGMG